MRDRPNDHHRKIGAAVAKRPLLPSEDVHHKDGNKADSRASNLEVLPHAEHARRTRAQQPITKLVNALKGKVKLF